MRLSVKHQLPELTRDLERIKKSAIPKATVQALNRTATGVRTDSVKLVSKETGYKQKDVRESIKIWKATRQKLHAEVNAREGKAKNLIHFVTASHRKPGHFNKAKRLKRGGTKYKSPGVKAKAWGKQKVYDGTFIGKGKNSNTPLVFTRTTNKRTPLKSVLGPSIRRTFDSRPIQKTLKAESQKRFIKNMTAAVRNQIRLASR